MALLTNRAKRIFSERNVDVAVPDTDYEMDAAYDLALYEELGLNPAYLQRLAFSSAPWHDV